VIQARAEAKGMKKGRSGGMTPSEQPYRTHYEE